MGTWLGLHQVSQSLAGPQRLCLSHCPAQGKVSPSQPSSPLESLGASSGGPPLWQLEMVQSGAVGVLVAHEQTPRQPLVPCSGEVLELQPRQRAHELRGAWIPCESRPRPGRPSWPNPSPTGEDQTPVLRTRKLRGYQKTLIQRSRSSLSWVPLSSFHGRGWSLLSVLTAPSAVAQGVTKLLHPL